MNSIEQLEALKQQVIELQEKLNKLTWKNKWEPKGGRFTIGPSGGIFGVKSEIPSKNFGTERETKEQAEKAAIKMRQFNRLLAYHDEFCPDYEFKIGEENYYVFCSQNSKSWGIGWNDTHNCIQVYFPENIAKELVKKLNSGEVEL